MKMPVCLLLLVIVGCSDNDRSETQPLEPANATRSSVLESESPKGETTEVFVIDVRSESEWDSGHVAQAVRIPHTEIAERIGEVTPNKNAKIVLYCAVGGRAGQAKEALEAIGFTNVENAGGYDDVKQRFE